MWQGQVRGTASWALLPMWTESNVNQEALTDRRVTGGKSWELVYDHRPNCLTSSCRPPAAWKNQWEQAMTAVHTGRPIGCRCLVWNSNIHTHTQNVCRWNLHISAIRNMLAVRKKVSKQVNDVIFPFWQMLTISALKIIHMQKSITSIK